ncbi:MAG: hypothetical protein EOS65_02415 [Mesorhizobium sp.]|uniref:hypothetical protein n=1 Tax=Mesorhizobium sp. TaxID=1871066 RepID=UPI000FE64157|nr:hypothetical protein [Mesorhizobium sp.]RWF44249.1 MAG: hypothetical protein EOS65_02415 [Mesorhizobium sp.]
MAITDEQISEWCAQAQGKCFGVIPQARYVIEAALTAATAVAVPGVVELTEFAKEMCRVGFDGSDASGGEILEAAEQHGLVRCEAYDPAVHSGITNSEYLNPGDSIYVFAGPLAASPSAQGMAQETDGGSSNAL